MSHSWWELLELLHEMGENHPQKYAMHVYLMYVVIVMSLMNIQDKSPTSRIRIVILLMK